MEKGNLPHWDLTNVYPRIGIQTARRRHGRLSALLDGLARHYAEKLSPSTVATPAAGARPTCR